MFLKNEKHNHIAQYYLNICYNSYNIYLQISKIILEKRTEWSEKKYKKQNLNLNSR